MNKMAVNTDLIYNIIRNNFKEYERYREDLFQEGCLELIKYLNGEISPDDLLGSMRKHIIVKMCEYLVNFEKETVNITEVLLKEVNSGYKEKVNCY